MNQSTIIASHTPTRPKAKYLPNAKLNKYLHVHIEHIDTIIVYLASLAARKAFGNVNAIGQIIIPNIP